MGRHASPAPDPAAHDDGAGHAGPAPRTAPALGSGPLAPGPLSRLLARLLPRLALAAVAFGATTLALAWAGTRWSTAALAGAAAAAVALVAAVLHATIPPPPAPPDDPRRPGGGHPVQ